MKELINNQGQGTEKVFLVVVDLKEPNEDWTPKDVLAEMEELIKACSGTVVESMIVRLLKPSASTFIGKGKIKEIAALVDLAEVDTVVFSHDLKGNQQRNLEKELEVKTIDRTQLILDIFAKHATTKEGQMQVELAQLEYLLPRLVGHGIELSRLGGGIGTLGPGETKLEIDRRHIGGRITKLKKGLKEVESNRHLKRKKRQEKCIPTVTLVGYTNAGKSTLLNIFTNAKQITKDGLFTTLDSLSRQYSLPNHQKIVFSDTVGFMHSLPHDLIEAFKATLEEVQEAELLIHVVDVSNPNFRQMISAVNDVLKELNAYNNTTILVLNKIDQLEDVQWLENLIKNYDHAVAISALNGENLKALEDKIIELLSALFVEINVNVPIQRMDLVNLVHEEGEVLSIKYYNDHINIRASIPANLEGKFQVKSK